MEIAFDIETSGLDPLTERITAIGVKTEYDEIIFTDQDEKKIVEDFWAYLRDQRVSLLIGFNIRSFDIPFLIVRTFKYGVKAVNLKYKMLDLRSAFNYYFNRYQKGTLEDYSKLINCGGKYNGIKSEMIPQLWKDGEIIKLQGYLLQDVRMTWSVYKRFKDCGLKW